MLVVPVYVPLLQGQGLSMSQVLQTQALFALTIALCEVPSGYLADVWGRRAMLVGSASMPGLFLPAVGGRLHGLCGVRGVLGVGSP